MTRWVHMPFPKASDAPLNDFNEYWEAAEQEREQKIDSGFKKRKAFFVCLHSLMCPVWQWLSFVKRTMLCCCSYSYNSSEEATLQSLWLWALEQRRAWVGETEHLSDGWRAGWDATHPVARASSSEENQLKKCPSVYQMHYDVISTFWRGRKPKVWVPITGGRSIKVQPSTFRSQSWSNHLNRTTHLSSDIKHNLRPASLMHMLFLTKRF